MKVGDKILCKKDCIMKHNNSLYYKKGNWYTVAHGREDHENEFLIKGSEDTHHYGIYFNSKKSTSSNWSTYYGEYFYTIRQMKLEKLRKI